MSPHDHLTTDGLSVEVDSGPAPTLPVPAADPPAGSSEAADGSGTDRPMLPLSAPISILPSDSAGDHGGRIPTIYLSGPAPAAEPRPSPARPPSPAPFELSASHPAAGSDSGPTPAPDTPIPVAAVSSAGAKPPAVPETLGKYRLLRRLGKGGMGVVMEAEDVTLGRHVAVKLLPENTADDPEALGRFLIEARAAARLSHPNTVGIHEIDNREGKYYIVMELVRGRSADGLAGGRPMPWRQATRIIADACRGLAAAHRAGVIHRDIKPANIMVTEDGVAKLADFGLAKAAAVDSGIGAGGPGSLTGTGMVVGTPHFMSPEQAQAKPLDGRTDLYSLGATYFTLLTGRMPYSAETSMQILYAHCTAPVPDPRKAAPDAGIPDAAAEVVLRAMAKQPADRFPDAAAMLAALERAAVAPDDVMATVAATAAAATVKPAATAHSRVPADPPRPAADPPRKPTGGPPARPATAAASRRRPAGPPVPRGAGRPSPAWLAAVVTAVTLSAGLAGFLLRGRGGHPANPPGATTPAAATSADPSATPGELPPTPAPTPTPGSSSAPPPATAEPASKAVPATTPTPSIPPPPAALFPVVVPYDATIAREHQRNWAGHLRVPVEIENSLGMRLTLIPPGEFDMGSDGPGAKPEETPRHRVKITRPYRIGTFEVTQGQYARLMPEPPDLAENGAGPDHPVGLVSHEDAAEFCRRLTELPAERKAGRRYRLPTEAEWEYACRAGTATAFNIGDELRAADANLNRLSRVPVGRFRPNAWGLYDMHGNVCEWCADRYAADAYARPAPAVDPKGPASGNRRVSRGGGFHHGSAEMCRSADRGTELPPSFRGNDIGFRVLCEVDGK
jgi:formylglycine-generating enzyme required for sulfatase activity